MTREQRFLIDVLRKAVKGETVTELPADVQCDAFFQEATDHAVQLVVYDAISHSQQPAPAAVQAAEVDAMNNFGYNFFVEQAQAELTEILDEINCPYVILKGLSASAWYAKPQTRQLGDVDFLVPPERMQEVARRMVALGYSHICIPGLHHENLEKENICLEMHREIAGLPTGEDGAKVEAYLSSVYDRRRRIQTDVSDFCVPCEGHQAVIQLLHIQNHILSGGIGLRHVMDWCCFVNNTAEMPFWTEEVLPLMKDIGLFHFTAVLTKMATVVLDGVCPEWARYPDDLLCADMLEDILTGGNFGHKDTRRNHCFGLFPDWKNQDMTEGKIYRLYHSLRATVLEQNPHAEGKPLKTGILMIWKALRYIVLFLFGKRPDLREVAALAAARESVYNRLKMFEKGDESDS